MFGGKQNSNKTTHMLKWKYEKQYRNVYIYLMQTFSNTPELVLDYVV